MFLLRNNVKSITLDIFILIYIQFQKASNNQRSLKDGAALSNVTFADQRWIGVSRICLVCMTGFAYIWKHCAGLGGGDK